MIKKEQLKSKKHPKMAEPTGPFKVRIHNLEDDKYADGGIIDTIKAAFEEDKPSKPKPGATPAPTPDPQKAKDFMKGGHFAEGGKVDMSHDDNENLEREEEIERHASIAAAIMAKKDKSKMMAEGGMVDLNKNAMEEDANSLDDLNEAAMKENYDDDMMDMSQSQDSNEHGDSIEKDKHDMVSAIRRKMRMKSMISR